MYLFILKYFFIESLSEARDKAEEARDHSDFTTDDDNFLLKTIDVPNSPAQSISSIPVYSGKLKHLFYFI